jgi:G3E family GTPase
MRKQPLPLLLLTGFLGSGKTSTLQHWLSHTDVPLKRVAVIINDFGEVNVDAALLQRRQLELRSITGGCVCCQSFDDLVEQVSKLAENPDLDLVWIETSGLADPEEVLDHLSSAALQDITVLRRMILVVDASDFPCSWRGRAVQEEQIRYADLVLLNKTDRVDENARLRVETTLRQLNPNAEIVAGHHGVVPPEQLSGDRPRAAHALHVHDEHCHENHEHHEGCGHDHGHDHEHDDGHHHHHDHAHDDLPHSAATFFLPLNEPVERGVFQRFLGVLPVSVFRAKGFVRFTDSPAQVHTFQQVRDQAELLVLPLDDAPAVATGLVFIGPQLDEARIRELARDLNAGQVVSS